METEEIIRLLEEYQMSIGGDTDEATFIRNTIIGNAIRRLIELDTSDS